MRTSSGAVYSVRDGIGDEARRALVDAQANLEIMARNAFSREYARYLADVSRRLIAAFGERMERAR